MEYEDQATTLTHSNPVTFYFDQVKGLELPRAFVDQHFRADTKDAYFEEVQESYDIFYDRFMVSNAPRATKHAVEEWYCFSREFLPFWETATLNQELEGILRGADLI